MVKPTRKGTLSEPAGGAGQGTQGRVRLAGRRQQLAYRKALKRIRQRLKKNALKQSLDDDDSNIQPAEGKKEAPKALGSPGPATDPVKGLEDFISTGRTGRRNAVPDISDEKVAGLSSANLPKDMAGLTCSDGETDAKPETAKDGKKGP